MFLTMLMVRDPDHVVRLPMRILAKKANLSDDKEEAYRLACEAVAVLESPDKRSHDKQDFDGRRLQKLEGDKGWLVLNGQKYQEEMKDLWTRMRRNQKQNERRAAARAASELGARGAVNSQVAADPITKADKRARKKAPAAAVNGGKVEQDFRPPGSDHVSHAVNKVLAGVRVAPSSAANVPISEPAGMEEPPVSGSEPDDPPVDFEP